MKEIELITDGACRGNPGVGAWAALLRSGKTEKELAGAEAQTTNNRMELMAVIQGLEALKRPCKIRVVTDSTYVQKGVQEWMPKWKLSGWKTASRKPVKNQDLWQRLDQALAGHEVVLQWVRGHSGHADNERVDQLANRAIDDFLQP